MKFQSLFLTTGESFKESKDTINDLRINLIIDDISMLSKEPIKDLLLIRLTKKEDIIYRQNILKDIQKSETSKALNEFSKNLEKVKRYIELSNNATFETTLQGWHLEATILYIKTVEELNNSLSNTQIESDGLNGFKDFLKSYINSDEFKLLKEESALTKKGLEEIEAIVSIRENKVNVNKFNSERKLNDDIEKIMSKLSYYKVENLDFEITESYILSNVEEKILEFIKKLNPEPFEILNNFHKKHRDFIEKTIEQFYREIQFFLAYLEYIEPIKKSGLSFCFPEIVERDSEIYFKNSFDLALAKQLSDKGEKTVTNELFINKGEKVLLVTGPNQGGKTTFARMFGQLFYFTALGLMVPGTEAKLFICDHIYTHFEKEETVQSKKGKLEDELLRAKLILDKATDKSVVILNEIFSATALEDAYFLAEFVIKKILNLGALAVLVTFMHKLYRIDSSIVPLTSNVDLKNPSTRTFKITRRETEGRSFAIYLAEKYCLTYNLLKERLKR